MRDVRFRRALSLAINRHEINQVIYYGLAREGANTVLPESPLYKPEFQQAYAAFDMAAANKLLDEVGLTKRDEDGFRLLPDGRQMTIIVDTAGAVPEESDVLELIRDSWAPGRHPSLHQALRARRVPQPGLRRRQHHVGLDGAGERPADGQLQPLGAGARRPERSGMAEMGPVPRDPRHVGRSAGHARGQAAPGRCSTNGVWQRTTRRGRTSGRRCCRSTPTRSYTIGTVAAVPQPVVVSNRLHNVPKAEIWSFSPGNYFGIYRPDIFWLDPAPQ